MSQDFLFNIRIQNPKPVEAKHQFVTFALPVAKGQLLDSNHLCLSDEQDQIADCQFVTAANWPDSSIKLIHVGALVSLPALSTKLFTVKSDPKKSKEHQQHIGSSTNTISFGETPLHLMNLSSAVQQDCAIGITLAEHKQEAFSPALITAHPIVSTSEKLVEKTVAGFDFNTKKLAIPIQMFCNSEFIPKTGQLILTLTLRNPNRAIHPGGTWDLGDENSFYFSELSICIEHSQIAHTLKVEDSKTLDLGSDESVTVTQQGSGGENWQSPVHINKDNIIEVDGPGYIVERKMENTSAEIITDFTGKRASPIVILGEEQQQCAIYTENFWQNFPSSVCINNNVVTIGLFPHRSGKLYELQPGEQKTFKVIIQNFETTNQAIEADKPLIVIYPENVFADSMLLPLLKHDERESSLARLIQNGLTSENNFFVKREKLDEYGWRNFGELFADHETEGYKGNDIVVSHYNNQYDPIYGFLRQYLNTGERKWFELADDLAKHVIDIDIYHTEEDKADYNGGLFWHTDHYCSAYTATHRTFSTKQGDAVYDGHAGGGGPGGQHCYTTGLMLHYWLSGNEQSKQTVLRLAEWITSLYEGSGTIFETLLSLKNRHRKDIKNIVSGRYPFDRGTGNYIVSLLDAYQLTNQQRYLDCAGKILKSSLSATDCIEERELEDVENTWFYTVLLQAACRYLLVKQGAGQIDHSFSQIQAALLHYASYMLEHEYPYLEKPEILEFPNQTWTGQDLRKANIFYAAAFFCSSKPLKQKLIDKGDYFYLYVTETLKNEPTVEYTRIQALLMQNSGYLSWFKENNNAPECFVPNQSEQVEFNHSVSKQLLNLTLSLNIKRELIWLRTRSAKINKFLNSLGLH